MCIKFVVTDTEGSPIYGANITVNGHCYYCGGIEDGKFQLQGQTDYQGIAKICTGCSGGAKFSYMVTAEGYNSASGTGNEPEGTACIEEGGVEIDVTLTKTNQNQAGTSIGGTISSVLSNAKSTLLAFSWQAAIALGALAIIVIAVWYVYSRMKLKKG